ncbi:MAG: hypothetical protein ACYTF1_22995, partial [Planctomycetota bacterium]
IAPEARQEPPRKNALRVISEFPIISPLCIRRAPLAISDHYIHHKTNPIIHTSIIKTRRNITLTPNSIGIHPLLKS